MSIPDYQSLMLPVLVAASKGEIRIRAAGEEIVPIFFDFLQNTIRFVDIQYFGADRESDKKANIPRG